MLNLSLTEGDVEWRHMSNRAGHVSIPTTAEQRERERLFSAQLREAECNGVKSVVAKDRSPKAVFRIIDNSQGLAETAYEGIREPGTSQVMCKEGCSWCCYQSVLVTAPEAFRIAAFLLRMEDVDERTEVVEKVRDLDRTTRGLSPKARTELQLPCAFLRDGRCVIYPVRPLSCAGFTSFNVEDCIRGYRVGFTPKSITSEKARTLVYKAVRSGLARGLREALPESDTAPLELSAAVVSALSSPDAAAEWLAGGRVFEGAHLAEDSA